MRDRIFEDKTAKTSSIPSQWAGKTNMMCSAMIFSCWKTARGRPEVILKNSKNGSGFIESLNAFPKSVREALERGKHAKHHYLGAPPETPEGVIAIPTMSWPRSKK